MTRRSHDKVEVFDVYHALKFPSIYEDLSSITVVDFTVESSWKFQGVVDIFIYDHKVSNSGLELDKDNLEVIEKFPPPISIKRA